MAKAPDASKPAAAAPAKATPTTPAATPAAAPRDLLGAKPVVFDTNALMLAIAHKTPLDDELLDLLGATTWLVPSSVLVELKTLAHKGDGATQRNARMALKYAEQRCQVITTKLGGDDGLLEVARARKAAVVTNDRTLQQECERSGLTVLVSREEGRKLAIKGSAAGRF